MKQVVLRSGAAHVADVPAPPAQKGRVLVANAASVVSSGTERAAVAVSGGSLPMRAIRNPDLVLLTLKHAKEHGIRETVELVKGAVSDDVVLGYSSAGIVLDTGGIADFRVGQAVACAGAGKANHAEVVSVPGNLVAPVPVNVELHDAAFTTLGAIALQGVRRAEPTLGERVVVVGLGLLGLLTVQLLKANGCQVIGVEPVERRRALALELGAERVLEPSEAKQAVKDWSGGTGADVVIITASTASDAVLNDAVAMVRRKGRVVPVGDVGMGIERAPLYQREADVLISTSYGPGRYDPSYEEGGVDYPISYVRWTENRNMEEFLRLLGTGHVKVDPLAELVLPVDRAPEAYAAINSDQSPFAAVITYDAPARADRPVARETVAISGKRSRGGDGVRVGVVGPGTFVRATHLPVIKRDPNAQLVAVAARTGTTASDIVRAAGGGRASSDWTAVVEDPEVDLVVIGTRHDTHAEISAAALRAGKAVFVEKPLGLSREELDDVWAAGGGGDARLAIGFNRPFAPLAQQLGEEVASATGPIHLVYRVNAPLAHGHWLNDPAVGGGRIQGEACHMFDFANWLCGTPVRVQAAALPAPADVASPESSSVTITYADGSVATVHYTGVGAGSMPKERAEVFRGGRSWVLDDYKRLESFAGGAPAVETNAAGDKGHETLMRGVLAAARGEQPFRPGLRAAYTAQAIALAALESIASGTTVELTLPDAGVQRPRGAATG